jgi:predicted nucleic acid-binding protein
MKVTADTNVLVRAVMHDDPAQARAAKLVRNDSTSALPISAGWRLP